MQIIVATEKHCTRYLDASTPEALAKSALKLLTERWNAGYWYHEPSVMYPETPILSEEEIAALPEHLRSAAKTANARAKRDQDERVRAQDWYDQARQIVADQDLGHFLFGRKQHERQVSKAWHLLDMRGDYEYEAVELESVETA